MIPPKKDEISALSLAPTPTSGLTTNPLTSAGLASFPY